MRTQNTGPWPPEGKLVARCFSGRFGDKWVVLDHEGFVVTSGGAFYVANYVNKHNLA